MNKLDKIIFNQNSSKLYIFKSFLKGFFLSLGVIFIITWLKIQDNIYKYIFLTIWLVVIILWVMLNYLKNANSYVKDERLQKVHSYAYAYSWNISLYSTLILLLLNQMDIIKLDLMNWLWIILFIMLISFILLSTWFDKKSL